MEKDQIVFPSKFIDSLNSFHTLLGGPQSSSWEALPYGVTEKTIAAFEALRRSWGAGRKTSVWFLFQELFTEIMVWQLLLPLGPESAAQGGAEAVTLGLSFKLTTYSSLRVDLLPLPFQWNLSGFCSLLKFGLACTYRFPISLEIIFKRTFYWLKDIFWDNRCFNPQHPSQTSGLQRGERSPTVLCTPDHQSKLALSQNTKCFFLTSWLCHLSAEFLPTRAA